MRGFIYASGYYGVDGFEEAVCPWCISDDSAHKEYGIEFNDPGAIGGHRTWGAASQAAINEVAYRTPGFTSWQEEM